MHRFAKFLLGGGLLLGAAALAWRPVVVPQTVKFPTNVDRTYHYAGSLVTFVDPQTGATLATPATVPLTIDRQVTSVPGATGAHVAVLKETITAHMGDRTAVQENVYALDRRTMKNISDPQAYTYAAGNVLDRSGTYYLTMPMGLDASGESLSIWKPEAGASYPLVSTTPARGTEGGTKVVYLQGTIPTPLPAPAYELAALQAQGFPMQLAPTALTAQLTASGVDLAAVVPMLAANLSATEMQAVAGALASPIPLKYFVYGHGLTGVEPTTGSLVTMTGVVDGIAVQPDLSAIAPVAAALASHADVPAIASLIGVFDKMVAAPPQPVYEMQYTQTPASVTEAAADARSDARTVTLMTTTIPTWLAIVGGLFIIAGAAVWFFQRRQPKPTATVEVRPLEKSAA